MRSEICSSRLLVDAPLNGAFRGTHMREIGRNGITGQYCSSAGVSQILKMPRRIQRRARRASRRIKGGNLEIAGKK